MNGTIVERSKTLSDARRRPLLSARATSPFGSDATKKIGSRSRKQGREPGGSVSMARSRRMQFSEQGNERVDPRYKSNEQRNDMG